MHRRSNINLHSCSIRHFSLDAIQHLLLPPTRTWSTTCCTRRCTSSSVAVQPTDLASGQKVSSVRNLQTVSCASLMLCVGSRHDVFCHVVVRHVVTGHATSCRIVCQSKSASCGPVSCHVIPCHCRQHHFMFCHPPWPITHVMSHRVRSCPCPCVTCCLCSWQSRQLFTVIATCEIHHSACTANAHRLWISATHKKSKQNVHSRTLNTAPVSTRIALLSTKNL